MNHRFRPAARRRQWYLADGGPAIAELFERAAERALLLLQFMPLLRRPSYPGVRTWPLKQLPSTLVYRVEAELITVIAVAHQSREPGYWAGR